MEILKIVLTENMFDYPNVLKQNSETLMYDIGEDEGLDDVFYGEYNNKEDAIKELDYLLKTDFPTGFKNIPLTPILYRVLVSKDGRDYSDYSMGSSFVAEESLITENWLESIGAWGKWTDDSQLYILKCKVNRNDIDMFNTIKNRLAYPQESEFTLKFKSNVEVLEKRSINRNEWFH